MNHITQPDSFALHNARIVLGDDVIERGHVAVERGRIVDIGDGAAPPGSIDLGGDLLLPGLIELHTDHLEAHCYPRPKVNWEPIAAVVSYDAQLATSGITTSLDSLRVWREESVESQQGQAEGLADAIAQAREAGLLRIEHFLHLRCEVPMPYVVEDAAALAGRPDVRLISLMDHTPGQRQFRDLQKFRDYYRGKSGMSDAEIDDMSRRRLDASEQHAAINYRELLNLARLHDLPLASHDDTTIEHVEQSISDRVSIAEFPTTVDAARRLHDAGIKVMMGAPNLVRGGSHSGNVAASDLADQGTLDILSSDYVPSSLLLAALRLPEISPGFSLPAAIATVTRNPAQAVGLHDRGEIAPGKRADIIRVHRTSVGVAVRSVWCAGRRVA